MPRIKKPAKPQFIKVTIGLFQLKRLEEQKEKLGI